MISDRFTPRQGKNVTRTRHTPNVRIIIEPETAVDRDAVRRVVARAFVHEPEVSDLVEAIRASPEYRPELALVARTDDLVAGFVMISGSALLDGSTRHAVHTLSPLAVDPDRQRLGIGSALVRAALAAAEAAGIGMVILEGSPRYYGRLGFRFAGDFGIDIDLPDWAPPEAAQVYPLSGYDPAVRGRVVYPPAFTELASSPATASNRAALSSVSAHSAAGSEA